MQHFQRRTAKIDRLDDARLPFSRFGEIGGYVRVGGHDGWTLESANDTALQTVQISTLNGTHGLEEQLSGTVKA